MGRPKKIKTKLARVPVSFDIQVTKMRKRYWYSANTDFLDKEGTTIFQNVDYINKIFKPFRMMKKSNVKNK